MSEMAPELKTKAAEVLRSWIAPWDIYDIRKAIAEDPQTWWAPYHFGWGMVVRNLLRKEVCPDNSLPSGNWDDYYVECVEAAVNTCQSHQT